MVATRAHLHATTRYSCSRAPQVRDLYKRILVVGADYPKGLDYVRERAKAEFAKRANVTDELDFRRAVNYGRYMVKEMKGVIALKKYRAMKARYYDT
jgi:hypothetical protein